MSEDARVEELFLRVVELTPARRAEVYASLGIPAPERERVEAWIEADASQPEGFLCGDEPAAREVRRIGPYHILERLGEGGMGTVYAARQGFPRREVALKVLRDGRINEDTVRRFRHEIEVLGRLQHSGIARIYDAGLTEVPDAHGVPREVPYFTMELVRGVPLVRYARHEGLLLEERLELLARVADAVHYAHQRGVIHRDLKAENVLVTTEESTSSARESSGTHVIGQPKVLDFGIARVVDADLQRSHETAAGALVGTLSSMSPEQVAGDVDLVDVRSDVYALGVMLYELIAGRGPHALEGLTMAQAARRITEEPVASPGRLDPALRGDLSTIALKALERDPERRYASAADLASDLRAFLAGEPIEARADSRLYLMQRSLRRHRAALGVALGLALLCAGFLLFSLRQARESERLARAEARARHAADADFERAVEAIDLLAEVGATRLAGVAGAEGPRRELLEAALGFYRGLLEAHPGGADLAGREAGVHYQVAHLLSDLGSRREALAELEEARASLARDAHADPDLVVAVGIFIGKLQAEDGRLAEAEGGLRAAARASGERLSALRLAKSVAPTTARLNYAASRRHLAVVLSDAGRGAEALEHFEQAHAELTEPEVVEPRLLQELVATLHSWTTTRQELGRLEGVEEHLGQALALAARLRDTEPGRPRHAEDLVAMGSNLGALLLAEGRDEEARATLTDAIAEGEALARAHAALKDPLRSLLAAYNNRGNLYGRLGELEAAEADFARATELLAALSGEQPSHRDARLNLTLQSNRSAILIYLERYSEAREAVQGLVADLARRAPGTISPQDLLLEQNARLNLSIALLGEQRFEESAGALSEVRYCDGRGEALELCRGVLSVACDGSRVGRELADPELTARFRAVATEFIEEARAAGFTRLPELAVASDWSELLEDPAFRATLAAE